MTYDPLDPLPWRALAGPLAAAEDALARLDERLGASPIRAGWIGRTHFLDACAALWLQGELVPLEDLVLRDAERDVRTPTHEIARAHAVLRARRRIAAAGPAWATSAAGLAALCHDREEPHAPEGDVRPEGGGDEDDALAAELAAADAVIARSSRVLAGAGEPQERDPLVYDLDWDEAERLERWRRVLADTRDLPPVLAAALAHDAWATIAPLQHRAWLGSLLCGALLRARGKARHHLPCLDLALRGAPRERRLARDGTTRLVAVLEAVATGAAQGIKDLERWTLAREILLRKLAGRRSSSRLPALVELVIARGLVSTATIADEIGVTPRAALGLVRDLGLREMTGRERYRVWGVI